MSKDIKLISFDLDDTLWPIEPVMRAVQKNSEAWLAEEHPQVLKQHSPEAIKQLTFSAYHDHPELRHNLTALRKISLKKLFLASGYDKAEADSHAQSGYEVFHQTRNTVDFFPHALSALEQLQKNYQLVALTNGNACLKTIGISHFFSAHFSSENVGVAKPDPAMFEAALSHYNLTGDQVVHVGDHPEQDIVAAKAVGMKTIWVNLLKNSWPSEIRERADHEVSCLSELVNVIKKFSKT